MNNSKEMNRVLKALEGDTFLTSQEIAQEAFISDELATSILNTFEQEGVVIKAPIDIEGHEGEQYWGLKHDGIVLDKAHVYKVIRLYKELRKLTKSTTQHAIYARHKYKILAECFEEMLKQEGIDALSKSLEQRIATIKQEDALAQEILKREEDNRCIDCGKQLTEEDGEVTKCLACWDKNGDD